MEQNLSSVNREHDGGGADGVHGAHEGRGPPGNAAPDGVGHVGQGGGRSSGPDIAAVASVAPTPPPGCSCGCAHYKRHCTLLAPCCGRWYACRVCHDDAEHEEVMDPKKAHKLDRGAVTTVRCGHCATEQAKSNACVACGVIFGGAYFCARCSLWDDVDKGQWHCDGCGICRVGGSANYFHCGTCNSCLAIGLRDKHKCVSNTMQGNCPMCLQDMHTSLTACSILPCGHALHQPW
jgi:RING finger/CHY zinc finger protein 1